MKQNRNIILLLLSLTMFLVVLDSAIINIALPVMKTDLHFDASSLQWVLTAYILTFGGFLMLGGRIADLYGRRRILVMGVAGFSLFSLLLGLTTSSTMLIILRALQGLAAAFMAPTALSILLTTFEEGEERNKALGVWSVVASSGAAAGVFLGGLLTQYLGWHWCFFVNVPIGFLAAAGILRYIPADIQETGNKHLDLPGAILVTSGLMALVYALTLAAEVGWTATSTLISLSVSGVLLAAFLFNETRAKYPLMPLSIFRLRNVSGGNLIMLPVVASLLGMGFFATLYIQNILHYSPVLSGLSFLPIPIIIGVISNRAPALLERFSFKRLLIVGVALMAVGIFLLTFLNADSSYIFPLLPAFVLFAIGAGIAFVSLVVAATSGIPADESGLASGLINTSQQIGGALGLAILSVVASTSTAADLATGHSLAQATMYGYHQAFLCSTVLIVMALLVTIFVIRTPKPIIVKEEEQENGNLERQDADSLRSVR